MRAEARLVEQAVGGGDRIVLLVGELGQQHGALALELRLGIGGVAHDVAEHPDHRDCIARHAVHVVRGVVLVGMRVHVRAQALGVEVDPAGIARGRALERHVLDHMADAVVARRFMGTARANEHAHRRGVQDGGAYREQPHAVGEGREGQGCGGWGGAGGSDRARPVWRVPMLS